MIFICYLDVYLLSFISCPSVSARNRFQDTPRVSPQETKIHVWLSSSYDIVESALCICGFFVLGTVFSLMKCLFKEVFFF